MWYIDSMKDMINLSACRMIGITSKLFGDVTFWYIYVVVGGVYDPPRNIYLDTNKDKVAAKYELLKSALGVKTLWD